MNYCFKLLCQPKFMKIYHPRIKNLIRKDLMVRLVSTAYIRVAEKSFVPTKREMTSSHETYMLFHIFIPQLNTLGIVYHYDIWSPKWLSHCTSISSKSFKNVLLFQSLEAGNSQMEQYLMIHSNIHHIANPVQKENTFPRIPSPFFFQQLLIYKTS